jgi:GTPase KRas protein
MSSFQIAIIGEGGVGKSAMTIQFIQSTFCDEYDPTIEDSYRKQVQVDGEVCVIDIIDTAGQEEYACMRGQYMRGVDGYIVVYSVASRSSFEGVDSFRDEIRRARDEDDSIPMVLVANKCDIRGSERQVMAEEGSQKALQWRCAFLESSAKTRTNIDEAFFSTVRQIRQAQAKAGKVDKKKKRNGCTLF